MPKKGKKKYNPTTGVRPRTDATSEERMAVFERFVDFVRKDGNEHRTDMAAVESALLNTYIRFCVELGIPPEAIEKAIAPCHKYHSDALDADGPVLTFREPTTH